MARCTRRAILGLSANGYTPIALSVRKLAPLSNDCYDYQIASFVLQMSHLLFPTGDKKIVDEISIDLCSPANDSQANKKKTR